MKKCIASLLSIVMMTSSIAAFAKDYSDYPQKFWDVPKTHWAFEQISELADKGIINGYENGSFKPDRTVDRGEWAKMMVTIAGLQTNDNNVYFNDMTNHWANRYVNTAKEYLVAYKDGSFKPDQAAAREDVTVSMVKLKGYDVDEVDYSALNQFKDVGSISNDLKKYVAIAVKKGLISGFEDNTFRGQDTLTRAEAATILQRAFQMGSDNKVANNKDSLSFTKEPDISTPAPTPTPKPTKQPTAAMPDTTKQPKPTATSGTVKQSETTGSSKTYKIDTLKSADIRSFTYDGANIYYLNGKTVYQLNPQTGKTDSIYNASKLSLQETEMQEKEITKTITKMVPVEETTENDEDDGDNPDNDTSEDSEPPKMKEITEEVTETVQEEVVIKGYYSYIPMQIIYDKYNDRLILNGYYEHIEEKFKLPQENARYYVAYDITNDALYMELGNPYHSSASIGFRCFAGKDKAIVKNASVYGENDYLINTDSMSKLSKMGNNTKCWTAGNNIYAYDNYYDAIYLYDFSADRFQRIYDLPQKCRIGISNDTFYYWDIDSVGKKFFKVNLSNGKASELAINANSENCEVLDMTKVNINNTWVDIIPISDDYFIFYDGVAKAFRTISKNK